MPQKRPPLIFESGVLEVWTETGIDGPEAWLSMNGDLWTGISPDEARRLAEALLAFAESHGNYIETTG